jgi:hypothetical protein
MVRGILTLHDEKITIGWTYLFIFCWDIVDIARFLKYNYVLSAALDGGAQIMILFLSMVFQGGDGKKVPFPT